MQFNLMNFLNASNPVVTRAIQQPGGDGLMLHGLSLVGLDGQASLRDALRDQAQQADTYLAVYVTPKDELDTAGTAFEEEYVAASLVPYRFGGNLLVHKVTYDLTERYQYKELMLDGLLSGKDYYYGIKLVVDGELQPGFSKGAFTTHGTAYAAPVMEQMVLETPEDNYRLLYNILEHDMSLSNGLVPRFEVVNRTLSELSPRADVFVHRDIYDPATPSNFVLSAEPGSAYQRYVMYDVQVRYLAKDGSPVGVSPPTKLASDVQIPWLYNFVDEVILKGGGIDQTILEEAASKVSQLTPAEREEMLASIADGDVADIGAAYTQLLKKAALENIATLEGKCNAMRYTLKKLLYSAKAASLGGKGQHITFDLNMEEDQRVFTMITAPADVRGYPLGAFVKFAEGAFYVSDDLDEEGIETGKTRVTYMGQVAFERFFINFNNRNA